MRTYLLTLALMTLSINPAAGQTPAAAGFLFAYRPLPNKSSAMEAGYERHLRWHRDHADTLSWFAWNVVAGPGLGLFVDGSFGKPFAAFDARVDPAGDVKDASATFLPFVEPAYREVLVLRDDLSSATPLESGTPTPIVQVLRYATDPGDAPDFEAELIHLKDSSRSLQPYTVYESLAGGVGATFTLMVWRSGYVGFDQASADPLRALRQGVRSDGARGTVRLISNEIWQYLPHLTYQPHGS